MKRLSVVLQYRMINPSSALEILISRFIKFALVGLSGVVIDYGVTILCKEKFKIHKYISNALGFSFAASSNYILNRVWTFASHDPQIVSEYGRFILVSLFGLLINSGVLWVFHGKLKMDFYFSKLIAIAFTTIWNFFANVTFTFHAA